MNNSIANAAKRLDLKHNVSIRVLDEATNRIVSEHTGHNASTNSLLTGIAHYLIGDGVLNQGDSLSVWVPRYMSLGTMGLINQLEDENGLPAGLGTALADKDGNVYTEADRLSQYMTECPGFGADGYDNSLNNNREYVGLGPDFENRTSEGTINCELITDVFPRVEITYREIVPEKQSEYPETIDIVFSAYISTGALSKFRDWARDDRGNYIYDISGNRVKNNYVFITEVGLWSRKDWITGGDNGLLAGYRIAPPDENNWAMKAVNTSSAVVTEAQAAQNREILKRNIIKVGVNQVVQVIWKIQLGGIKQLVGLEKFYSSDSRLRWHVYSSKGEASE